MHDDEQDRADPTAGGYRALPTDPLPGQRSAAPGVPPPARTRPTPPATAATPDWGPPSTWWPPPAAPAEERLDHVSRVLWAVAALALIGVLPFVATWIAAGSVDPIHQRSTSGALRFFLWVALVLGGPAAAVTYGFACIRRRSERSALLGMALVGSALAGFVVGFLGVFSITSPTVGDH